MDSSDLLCGSIVNFRGAGESSAAGFGPGLRGQLHNCDFGPCGRDGERACNTAQANNNALSLSDVDTDPSAVGPGLIMGSLTCSGCGFNYSPGADNGYYYDAASARCRKKPLEAVGKAPRRRRMPRKMEAQALPRTPAVFKKGFRLSRPFPGPLRSGCRGRSAAARCHTDLRVAIATGVPYPGCPAQKKGSAARTM
jgi:hypothetical protein